MTGVVCPACGTEVAPSASEPEGPAEPSILCPACDRALVKMAIGSITADVCQDGCGGVWLDNQELTRSVSVDEDVDADVSGIRCHENIKVDPDRKRKCPTCVSMVLQTHYEAGTGGTQVDQCLKCGGIWFDRHELEVVRDAKVLERTQKRKRPRRRSTVSRTVLPYLTRNISYTRI
ncbi:zf-TFIIB domain-containing protein [Verrucomicrobiota bacterium]